MTAKYCKYRVILLGDIPERGRWMAREAREALFSAICAQVGNIMAGRYAPEASAISRSIDLMHVGLSYCHATYVAGGELVVAVIGNGIHFAFYADAQGGDDHDPTSPTTGRGKPVQRAEFIRLLSSALRAGERHDIVDAARNISTSIDSDGNDAASRNGFAAVPTLPRPRPAVDMTLHKRAEQIFRVICSGLRSRAALWGDGGFCADRDPARPLAGADGDDGGGVHAGTVEARLRCGRSAGARDGWLLGPSPPCGISLSNHHPGARIGKKGVGRKSQRKIAGSGRTSHARHDQPRTECLPT